MAGVGQALDVAHGGITFHFGDAVLPRSAILLFNMWNKLFENFAGVADKCSVYRNVFVNFGAIDFDVNFAGALGVGAQIAGDAIIEAHADRDQQIGFLNGVIDPGFAVHAHHAEIERIAGREAADAQKRHGNVELPGANELLERPHGAGDHDAVSGKNQRALGGIEQFDGAIEFGFVDSGANPLWRKLRSGGVPVKFRGSLLCILGDIHQNGTWAPGVRDVESFANGARDIFRARDDDVVFGDGHGDAGDVDLLEGIGTEKLAANLSGDADNGRRIKHRSGDTSDHVGGAGTAGGHGHADAASRARVAVGHVRCSLLVAHQDVVQLRFTERVVDGQNRAARVTENVSYAQMFERLAKYFRASELHSVLPDCTGCGIVCGRAVTAPRDADETRNAYLAMTPLVKRGAGGVQSARRCLI